MKLAVVGPRDFSDKEYIYSVISVVVDEFKVTEIVSGGARGVDTIAELFSSDNGLSFVGFLPQYDRYGKTATIIRNRLIVKNSDMVLAFWNGKSRGTKSTIDIARRDLKPFIIWRFDDETKSETSL